MTKILVLILSLAAAIGRCQQFDSTATHPLTPDTSTAMSWVAFTENPDSLECFRLDGAGLPDTNGLIGFPVLQRAPRASPCQISMLHELLRDSSNFYWDGRYKRCAFAPDLGFRVWKNSRPLVVLMANDCDTWQLHYGDEAQLREPTPGGRRAALKLAAEFFPTVYQRPETGRSDTTILYRFKN